MSLSLTDADKEIRRLVPDAERLAVHQCPVHAARIRRLHHAAPMDMPGWIARNGGWFVRSFDEIYAERRPYPDPGPAFMDPGIYFLFTDELAYVGLSNCVERRLREHAQPMSYGLPCPFRTYAATWCPEPWLEDLEQLYIEKFKPAFNYSRPATPTYLRKYL